MFIPRPETYDLVNIALSNEFNHKNPLSAYSCSYDSYESEIYQSTTHLYKKSFLEIGGGSGIISISLIDELKRANLLTHLNTSTICDINPQAISVISKNSKKFLKSNKNLLDIIHSDFKNLTKFKFDFIISNPPYIGK